MFTQNKIASATFCVVHVLTIFRLIIVFIIITYIIMRIILFICVVSVIRFASVFVCVVWCLFFHSFYFRVFVFFYTPLIITVYISVLYLFKRYKYIHIM